MTDPILFAADGEPCTSCGAPLAADQRYCLACGHRRAAARLPFLDMLREPPVQLQPLHQPLGVGGMTPPSSGDSLADRARANTGVVLGVGVLLLAMLIGVLVGSGLGRDDSALANQKPLIVSVGGGAAVAPAASTAAPTDTGAATTATPEDSDKASDGSSSSDKSSKAAEEAIKPKAAPAAKLKSLGKLSGKEYQKQVDKLGKNISVGGKPPPKDNKPAAGGGDFEDIG